jgi:hypothetical protein
VLGVPLSLLALSVVSTPALASEGEACPNEPYRLASNSTRLPECRAFELVSPAEAGGPVTRIPLEEPVELPAGQQHGFGSRNLASSGEGNLATELGATALDVQANGSAVFWESELATMPGTGKIEDGQDTLDSFRSARTFDGWTTKDLLPSGLQVSGNPGGVGKMLLGTSADGSSALILTSLALYPSVFANPPQAETGEYDGFLIYRVFADGAPPQLVTRFERLLPENGNLPHIGPFEAVSASPDLSEVAFRSVLALETNDVCNTSDPLGGTPFREASMYLWNASAINGLANTIFDFGFNGTCNDPNVTYVPAILPDGHPIIMGPGNFGIGPLVEKYSGREVGEPQRPNTTPLAGPSGGALLSVTPDGTTAYVQAAEAIDSNFPNAAVGTYHIEGNACSEACQIYAVNTTLGSEHTEGTTPGVTCISCTTDQTEVSYIGASKDGSHVLFTTGGSEPGLWEWDATSGAHLLTTATGLNPADVVISENGRYVLILTPQALVSEDTNDASDLYELSSGQEPQLITSDEPPSTEYMIATDRPDVNPIAGVSNDGRRIVYNAKPPEVVGSNQPPRWMIEEWDAGQTTELSPHSPEGRASQYQVQAIAGGELENVFFIAYDPLVPWDFNAGQADVYDARIDGGFPFCTPGNPGPPPGVERCGSATSNADPSPPITPAYPANLTPSGGQLPPLPPDSSQDPPSPKQKPLTRAQELAKALKACKPKRKKRRAACESQAREKFGAKKASARSRKDAK